MTDPPKLVEEPSLGARITKWAIFTVALSLFPILVNFVTSNGKPFTWETISGHGDLFLIAFAISTDALSRALNKRAGEVPGLIIIGLSVVFAASAIFIYGYTLFGQERAKEVFFRAGDSIAEFRKSNNLNAPSEQEIAQARQDLETLNRTDRIILYSVFGASLWIGFASVILEE